MTYVAFGDESGIHRRQSPVYGIGCFVVRGDEVGRLSADLREVLARHEVLGELKWTKVGSFRPRSAAALEGVSLLLERGARFSAIVVEKASYRKWQGDREEAFYQTYYQLARQIGRAAGGPFELRIDQRHDRYAKRLEVLEIVTNHSLARIAEGTTVRSVAMQDSKEHVLLQFTDVLIGAVVSDTSLHVDSGLPVNEGKRQLIEQLAGLVGWPRLYFDTYPNDVFNVWHFPREFRGPTRLAQISRPYSSAPLATSSASSSSL